MIKELKEVRDALAAYNTSSTVKHPLIREHGIRALATLDRIIADHIQDVTKMVVPEGFKLVPKKILESLHQKPVCGNYDYQCGYLDCLKDAKAMISAAPQPPTKGD